MMEKQITSEQQLILDTYLSSRYIFKIPEENWDQYHGCGHGWIEFGPDGEFTKMRYGYNLDGRGSIKQNVNCETIKVDQVLCTRMKNGFLRLKVNFSCGMACGF